MNTEEILRRFEQAAEEYVRELDRFTLEQLKTAPGEEEWSLGQMYAHLAAAALRMQLANAARCIAGEGDEDRGKSEAGEAVFALGGFPPTRVRVPPSPQYTPAQPDSKEQLAEGIRAVVERMREIEPQLARARERVTVPHPRLGGLNATEWFALVEMHFRHHRLQKKRLEAFLGL